MNVGKAISTHRKEWGLTQGELSSKTRLSRPYISDVENGRYSPNLKSLKILADALELTLSDLLEGVEEAK